jgi:hypothetical protein
MTVPAGVTNAANAEADRAVFLPVGRHAPGMNRVEPGIVDVVDASRDNRAMGIEVVSVTVKFGPLGK